MTEVLTGQKSKTAPGSGWPVGTPMPGSALNKAWGGGMPGTGGDPNLCIHEQQIHHIYFVINFSSLLSKPNVYQYSLNKCDNTLCGNVLKGSNFPRRRQLGWLQIKTVRNRQKIIPLWKVMCSYSWGQFIHLCMPVMICLFRPHKEILNGN